METHHYNTRTHDFVHLVKHEFAKKSLKYIIPKLICNTPISIKVYTHSLEGFNLYVKRYYLNNYTFTCDSPHWLYMSNRVLKLHRNINKINNFIDSIPPNDFIMIDYVLVNIR